MYKKILSDKRVRYVITGGTSFIVEYVSFLLLIYIGSFSAWLGQATSYSIGLIVSFLLLRCWAFNKSGDSLRRHVIKYSLLVAVNLPITSIVLDQLVAFGVTAFIAKVVVVAMAALWNYIIYDRLIFKERLKPEDIL